MPNSAVLNSGLRIGTQPQALTCIDALPCVFSVVFGVSVPVSGVHGRRSSSKPPKPGIRQLSGYLKIFE